MIFLTKLKTTFIELGEQVEQELWEFLIHFLQKIMKN